MVRADVVHEHLVAMGFTGVERATRRAVELARLGDKPVAALAKDLGISESCLRSWMAQAEPTRTARQRD
ncbi:transposase [Amycolatopsis azurea]|uniref:transposase n=1 Tax=Amycolatopsis azurea TaxID=36819 RepID=UPI003814B28F